MHLELCFGGGEKAQNEQMKEGKEKGEMMESLNHYKSIVTGTL